MGRHRNIRVKREKNGRAQRHPDRVHPETVFVRQRELAKDGVNPDQWQNALAGFTLGKLYLRSQANPDDPGSISEVQYNAGETWAKIVRRHASIMGYSLTIRTPSFQLVGGMSCAGEPEDDEVIAVRRKFNDCYDELMCVCRDHGLRVRDVTYGVSVENWPVDRLSPSDFGRLRIGLNAIAKVLK